MIAGTPSDDLLAGPSITDEEVTYQDMQSRRLQETGKKATLNSRQQLKFWMTALESIDLRQDQQIAIKALVDELRAKQHEYQKTYGSELSKIRKEQRDARQGGKTPTEALRKRMMEMMGFAPDPTMYQERVWALLTPDQQHNFKIKYQAILAEETKRREARLANDRHETDAMMQRDTDRKPENDEVSRRRDDRVERQDNVDNDSMLRRIRFLRRLQELKRD